MRHKQPAALRKLLSPPSDKSCRVLWSKYFIDLFPEEKEEDIETKLANVFQSKFPLISSNFFEYVKCCRRTIPSPTVCNDFKWNFGHIKSHAGPGKCAACCTNPC